MAIDWDLLVLAPCQAAFGEEATYMPVGGEPYDIAVIFDEANKDLSLLATNEVNTLQPVAGVREVEFHAPPKQGDRIRIKKTGITYRLRDTDPDGHGNIKLKLNVAGAS